MARELELGPVWGLSHALLVFQLGAGGHYGLAVRTLATVSWGFPPCIPVWTLDWGQGARHKCPLEMTVSKVS